MLSILGLAVSLYLTYVKLTNSPVRCKFGSCEIVQNSEYAAIYGVPVAILGVLFYFILFALTYYQKMEYLKLWTGIGFAFSLYLTYIELFVIHAICEWCVLSAVFATLAFLIALSLKPKPASI